MRLKVLLPTEILIDEAASKICGEADNGGFCLLPRHIDFVTALAPGLLSYIREDDDQEIFLAINAGILVKCGPQVMVSTPSAVRGPDLGTLKGMIDEFFQATDERERTARSALVKLEAELVRQFVEIGKQQHV